MAGHTTCKQSKILLKIIEEHNVKENNSKAMLLGDSCIIIILVVVNFKIRRKLIWNYQEAGSNPKKR